MRGEVAHRRDDHTKVTQHIGNCGMLVAKKVLSHRKSPFKHPLRRGHG
jgi:hypothetical protein